MPSVVIDDARATGAVPPRRSEGFNGEVHEPSDGEQGLAVLAQEQTRDLVLADRNLPVSDGLTFVESVCVDGAHDGSVRVTETTESDTDHLIQVLDAEADEYVVTPFAAAITREVLRMLGVEV